MSTERVIDRIRKMLALANDAACNAGERDNALRMVHATLAKYNIDMTDCEAKGQESTDEQRAVERTEGFNSAVWARTVAGSCAKLFFCEFFTSGNGKRYCYVGKTSNILTARDMAQYLIESIGREATTQGRINGWSRSEGTDFRRGAAAALYRRIEQMVQDAQTIKAEVTASTALALANVYESEYKANRLMIREKVPGLRSSSGMPMRSGNATQAGRAFGASVSLNRQVSGAGQRRITG